MCRALFGKDYDANNIYSKELNATNREKDTFVFLTDQTYKNVEYKIGTLR